METLMARLGIRAAAREVGIPHATLYVAAARRLLPSEAIDGLVTFDPGDLKLFKARLNIEAESKRTEFIAREDAKFKRINQRRESTGNRG